MKITEFDDTYTLKLGAGSTTLVAGTSGGSNSAFGGDVVGSAGSLSVVGLRQTVSLASNIGGTVIGDVLTIIQTSPRLAMFATPSNTGGGSFGSNATEVGNASSPGAGTNIIRDTHVHKGVHSLAKSGSSALFGDVTLSAGTNVTLTQSGNDISIASSGGGGASTGDYDPITDVFGAPTTAYEFDTSSFTGLTAMGSPTAESANTTIPGQYYVKNGPGVGGYQWYGRYATVPSAPFTVITKVTDNTARANYNGAGLFVGIATPGNMDIIYQGQSTRSIFLERVTPTAFGSSVSSQTLVTHSPVYMGIRATSSTSFDYYVSWNGRVWYPLTAARNPGITIATAGICVKTENANECAAAFEFLRIWNTSKTFPGI